MLASESLKGLMIAVYRCLGVGILLAINPVIAFAAEDPDPISDPNHFDVIVHVEPAMTSGGRLVADAPATFPREHSTRRVLVPANFGDFAGGPYKTDDPGWVVPAGHLLPGEILRYRALGRLLFWDNDLKRWSSSVPRGETVRLFGEVPTEVVLRNDPSELQFYRGGTVWTTEGVEGPREAAIEAADGSGAIHSHLDFCVQDSGGDCGVPGLGHSGAPTAGAYLITLQLFVSAVENGRQKYRSSNELVIVLNRGLTSIDFQQSVQARVSAPSPGELEPLPAAGILIISQN